MKALEEAARRALESGEEDPAAIARAAASTRATPGIEALDTAIERLLDRASVRGAFTLEALVPAESPDAARLRSALLRRALPEPGRPGRFVLDPALRQTRLSHLREAGQLDAMLGEEEVAEDDALGHRLRAAMRGTGSLGEALAALDPQAAKAGDAELRESLRLAGWLSAESVGDRHALRSAIAVAAEQARLEEEVASFVGREPLLEWIEAQLFPGAEPGGGDFPPTVALQGIGGIGKSAILAKLQVRLAARAEPPLTIALDFDRPGLETADAAFLTRELMIQLRRQIELKIGPAVDPELRLPRFSAATSKAAQFESATSAYDVALSDLRAEARASLASERPLVLLLDTFEERQRGGAPALDEIVEWLRDLVMPWGGGLARLSVLIAGRAELDANGYPFPAHAARPVDELAPGEAVALLRALGHPPAEARALAAVGGNPLLLRLVSNLVQRGGQTAAALTADLGDADADAALVQGLVYERILQHVKDLDARRLAYPGLVLREVTPRLVADVMAPLCLGREVSLEEARRLFEALAAEVWLVERSGPDRVRHRRDIRRVMLHRLRRDPVARAQAEAVHARALAFFEAAGEAEEAAYHRTMLAAPEDLASLDEREARRLRDRIGFDEEHLDPGVRATLRALSGDTLSDEEVGRLPPGIWRRTMARLGPELVERGHFERALALWHGRPSEVGPPPPVWHRRAEDALAAWETPEAVAFVSAIPPPDDDLLDWLDAATLTGLRRGRPDEALAVALSLTSALGIGGETAPPFLSSHARQLYEHWRALDLSSAASPPRGAAAGHRARIARIVNYAAIACHLIPETGGRCLAGPAPAWEDTGRMHDPASIAVDAALWLELRRAQQLGVTEPDPRLPVVETVFVPSPDWLEAVELDLSGAPHAVRHGLDTLRRSLLDSPPQSSELTGGIARHCALLLNSALLEGAPLDAPLYGALGFPEHRLPLRHAIGQAIIGSSRSVPTVLADLAEMFEAALTPAGMVQPPDLSADAARRVTRSRLDRALIRLVAYADQAQLLPRLAEDACLLFEHSEALPRVRDDLERWAICLGAAEPQAL